jgi:hypothetical protein
MLKGGTFRAAYKIIISEIFSPRSLLGVNGDERRLVVYAGDASPHTAKVTRAFCDDDFLRIISDSRDAPD